MTKQKEPTFLISTLFEELTLYGKCPSTEEEFIQMYSNKEYEKLLLDILKAYDMVG